MLQDWALSCILSKSWEVTFYRLQKPILTVIFYPEDSRRKREDKITVVLAAMIRIVLHLLITTQRMPRTGRGWDSQPRCPVSKQHHIQPGSVSRFRLKWCQLPWERQESWRFRSGSRIGLVSLPGSEGPSVPRAGKLDRDSGAQGSGIYTNNAAYKISLSVRGEATRSRKVPLEPR